MTDEERLMVEAVRRGLINPAPPDPAQIDDKTGAPLRIRVTVGATESPADKLATLRDTYPDAQPYKGDNFVFTNPETKRPTLYNPKGMDFGDVASLGPEISEAIGGIGGGALAGMAGVPTGGAAWAAMPAAAGLGAAGGREAYRLLVRGILGGRDTRSVGRQVGDAATTAGLNTVGARFADVLPGFIKNIFGAGRNSATGSTPAHVIEDFAAFGARPTAGQATGNAATQGLENAAAKMATGARTMQDFATEQVGQVARGADALANRYGGGRTAEDAGVALQRGAQDFITRFQGQADQLFDRVRNFLPRDTPANVTNTVQALRGMSDQFGSAQSLAARVENPQLRGILDALVQDAQRGPIPYQAVAALRSKIGRQLNDRVAVSDIPRAELEAVYGALSQDMRATAERAGPEALAAFDRANRFYRAGMQRVEGVIDRVVKANAPERAYAFAMGAENSQLRALRRSMPPEAWDVVASTTLRDLGRGRPGVQNAAGDVWSPATFLTEYNKIAQAGTSDTLFRGTRYAQLAPELDRLARVTAAMKDTAKMANPSGTAQQNYYMRLLTPFGMGGGLGAMAAGQEGAMAGGMVAGVGNMLVPAVASRLLTNPRFVGWLADAGAPSSRNIVDRGTAHLARLVQIGEANPEIRDEINQFLTSLRMPPAAARSDQRQ